MNARLSWYLVVSVTAFLCETTLSSTPLFMKKSPGKKYHLPVLKAFQLIILYVDTLLQITSVVAARQTYFSTNINHGSNSKHKASP